MLMLLVNEKRTLQQMNLSYVTLTYTITYCCINIIMLKQQREAETVCVRATAVCGREGSFSQMFNL